MSKAAWDDATLADPHRNADKAQRVRAMFAAIAPSYDLNNRVHSLGRDQAWRRAAVKAASLRPGDHVLDVACGTGDLSVAFANALQRINRNGRPAGPGEQPRVVGLDFTFEMLPLARRKGAGVVYVQGDAMRLPFADASFDVVSIAFGLRNVAEPMSALREFHRVLRPGGRVVVLEFTLPGNPVLRLGYRAYCEWLMPRTATLIAGDRSGAYRYLPRSVATFPGRPGVERWLVDAGFGDASSRGVTLGIAAVYRGVRGVEG